jgi:hypothetical protein
MTYPSPDDYAEERDRILPYLAILTMVVGFAGGMFVKDVFTEWDRAKLGVYLDACGYQPHGISDLAWEVYREGFTSAGPAYVSTRMVMSANIEAAECLYQGDKAVPRYWKDHAD